MNNISGITNTFTVTFEPAIFCIKLSCYSFLYRGNWLVNPLHFGRPNILTIIRNKFFFPSPPDGKHFLRRESVDLFRYDPGDWV
jgi:hypothetical protein